MEKAEISAAEVASCALCFKWWCLGKKEDRAKDISRRKVIRLCKKYGTKSVDLSKLFIYFALHYQPEMTSTPMAGYYTFQLLAIRMLAYHCRKRGVFIYVKENPKQTMLTRTEYFYKELGKIENVLIVPPNMDSFLLGDKCIAAATLTGTVAWESMFRQKPTLYFGYYFTQYGPGVYPIRTNADCEKALQNILEGKNKMQQKDIKLFFLAAEQYCTPGLIDELYIQYENLSAETCYEEAFEAYVDYIDHLLR